MAPLEQYRVGYQAGVVEGSPGSLHVGAVPVQEVELPVVPAATAVYWMVVVAAPAPLWSEGAAVAMVASSGSWEAGVELQNLKNEN